MEKVKAWIKKYKGEITIGVIVGIITNIVWLAGKWIIDSAPELGHTFWGTLVNYIYSSAALQTDSSISKYVFSILLSLFLAFVVLTMKKIGTTFKLLWHTKNKIKRLSNEEKEKEIEQLMQSLSSKNNKSVINADEIKVRSKKIGSLMVSMVIMLTLLISIFITSMMIPYKLWNDFERNIIIIAPYVDEKDVLMLKSDWVQMKSKADYEDIYNRINEIKTENNLKK